MSSIHNPQSTIHNPIDRYVAVIMVAVVLVLTGLGLVMISSTAAPLPDSSGQLNRQLIWLTISFLGFGVIGWVDYKVWRRWAWIFFILSLGFLIMLFIPGMGSRVKGATRWLSFGPVKIQPSEFLRIVLVLLLGHTLAKHQTKLQEWKWGFVWPLTMICLPLILLKFEPDFGTMILILATTLTMMFIAGSRIWPLLGAGGMGAIAMTAILWMMPERRARILAFLNPEKHKEDKFFQIWQGILAFGSGGTQGLGLGNSRQKMFYLPESTTDSIFPIIGEELGFYITCAVVLAYAIILICGLWISMHSKDTFGMLLGFGLVFGLSLQAMINIATVTGMIPPKGMPLPFVSYGGSNLLISYVAIGFLISIHRQSLRAKRFASGISIDNETPRI